MKKSVGITFIMLISGISNCLLSQTYNIEVEIKNLGDSTVFLGYYYGDKQYAKDTLVLDSKGKGAFEGKDTLQGGIYFILVPGNMFFEIVIDKDPKFSLSTTYNGDAATLTKQLSSKGSDEMALYLDYQKFMTRQGELAIKLRDKLKTTTTDDESKLLKDSLQVLHNEVKAKWDIIEKEHSETLLASILLCNKEFDIPEPPKDENGTILDSSFQYNFYKKHYFDYVNFSDERLIRTQFYHPKIDRYFEKMIIPMPDTVIKESKYVLDMAMANEEVFKYTLQLLFNKYNNSNIMGMDKVFVFFAETYYLNGKAPWADQDWLKKVEERVFDLKPNLIGNKAEEIRLVNPNDEFISMHQIKAEYTVLFFYEPGCGHCKKTTPLMKTLADKYWEKGVEVLGIYTQFKKEEWIKFIEEQELDNWINGWDPYNQSNYRHYYDIKSTPSIYLLDKDKNIIGKRIDVETVEKILEDEFKRKKQ